MTPTEPSTPDEPFLIRDAAPILADMLTHSILVSAEMLPLEVGAEVDTPFGRYGLSMKLAELSVDAIEGKSVELPVVHDDPVGVRLELQAERAAQEIERREAAHDGALRVLWSRIFGR